MHTLDSGITVVQAFGECRVVAMTSFAAGDRILMIEGDLAARPSRYSIQFDDDLHIEAPADAPARFLNHSCEPSAMVRGRAVIALRDLDRGDEITFDYNTTEYAMAACFACRCTRCDGREIGGFSRLDPAGRERLRPLLAEHLRRRL